MPEQTNQPQEQPGTGGVSGEMGATIDAPEAVRADSTPANLTIQDLLDIPRQILPEQTYQHLQNAGREATLALTSLINSLNRRGQGGAKVRRHIDVD
jgi:hypothetical protein